MCQEKIIIVFDFTRILHALCFLLKIKKIIKLEFPKFNGSNVCNPVEHKCKNIFINALLLIIVEFESLKQVNLSVNLCKRYILSLSFRKTWSKRIFIIKGILVYKNSAISL